MGGGGSGLVTAAQMMQAPALWAGRTAPPAAPQTPGVLLRWSASLRPACHDDLLLPMVSALPPPLQQQLLLREVVSLRCVVLSRG